MKGTAAQMLTLAALIALAVVLSVLATGVAVRLVDPVMGLVVG